MERLKLNSCEHEYEIEYNLSRTFMIKKCSICGNITSEPINRIHKKLLRAGGLIE